MIQFKYERTEIERKLSGRFPKFMSCGEVVAMGVHPEYECWSAKDMFKNGQLPLCIMLNKWNGEYKLHAHDFAELSLVIRGNGTEILNGHRHHLQRGTVSILLPSHMHEIHGSPVDPVVKYCCMFETCILFGNLHESALARELLFEGRDAPFHFDLTEEQTARIERLLSEMMKEYSQSGFGKDVILRSILLEAIALVLRFRNESVQRHVGRDGENRYLILEILRYIHLHYNEKITLSSLSSRFNSNYSYLSRLFKQAVGTNYAHYLQSLRIHRASSLLTTTTVPLTEIAFEVGFGSSKTFCRTFKKIKGKTPSQFREASRLADAK